MKTQCASLCLFSVFKISRFRSMFIQLQLVL
ncbi:hypothetical protein T10_2600 [Trichinella papuae]|uniref:Uncharacterized protein n=1 Tax=Trichinella papuae TaxID=268474 RepID=A0A0V1LX08_9BILA|nr:hypothetical protein T10_2600 [Trichinella papuae]